MESTMPKRKKIALVLIILVLCFIWGQSLLDGDTSTRESDFIYNLIYPFLYHVFGEVDATSHLLRKLAHFAEYAALGCSLSLYFGYDQRSILKGMNAALLAAQILAVEDADLAAKLDAKRKADAEAVLAKDAGIMERL